MLDEGSKYYWHQDDCLLGEELMMSSRSPAAAVVYAGSKQKQQGGEEEEGPRRRRESMVNKLISTVYSGPTISDIESALSFTGGGDHQQLQHNSTSPPVYVLRIDHHFIIFSRCTCFFYLMMDSSHIMYAGFSPPRRY